MKAIRIAALAVALIAGSASLSVVQAQAGGAPQQGGGGRGGRGPNMLVGIELTEALYAGIVQVLFEDAGVEDAFGQVVRNRALISGYSDAGADPSELTLHVLSRR